MVDWDGTTFTGGSYDGPTDDDRDSNSSSDDDSGSTRPGSSVPNNLSGGGGSSDDSDDDLSSVGDDDDSGPSLPDEPSVDNDNPFDDGGGSDVPAGNTPSSGNLPSSGGDSTGDGFTDPQGGSGGGFDGSNPQSPGGQNGPADDGFAGTPGDQQSTGGSAFDEALNETERFAERRSDVNEQGEVFGGRGDFERQLRGTADTIRDTFVAPTAEASGSVIREDPGRVAEAATRNRLTGTFVDVAAAAQASDSKTPILDETFGPDAREDIVEGTVEGAGEIANPAALGVTAIEAGETVVAGGEATAEGEPGEFASEAAGAAARQISDIGRAAQENPERVAGQLVGSSAGTAGAIRGASRIGGARTGRAVSTAIQPGEEAAIFAARRGVPGTRRLADTIGDNVDTRNPRDFAGDESAQMFGSQSSRSGTASETDAGSDLPTIQGSDIAPPARGPSVRSDAGGSRGGRRGPSGGGDRGSSPTGGRGTGGRTGRSQSDPRLRQDNEAESAIREQAEQPEVTQPEAETGVVEDLATRALRGTEAAVAEDAAVRPELDVEQVETPAVDDDLIPDTEPVTIPEPATETRPEIAQEPQTETPTRQETRTESRQETRQETRRELRQETTEARRETRRELRAESRREASARGSGGDDNGDEEDPFVQVDLEGVRAVDAQVETTDPFVDPFEDP